MGRHRTVAGVLLAGVLALAPTAASGGSATAGATQARAGRADPAVGVLVTHSPRTGGPSMSSCGNMDSGT